MATVAGKQWNAELTEQCWSGQLKPFSIDVAVARKEILVVCFPEEIESNDVLSCFTAMLLMEQSSCD
ncbi:hypothetical protein DM2_2759 [Halorubrum sp. DM2]|nr:hypothetical protein DM2_2759 [Halorubrum sp. DM2]